MFTKDIWSLIAEHIAVKDFLNFSRVSKIVYAGYKQMNNKREIDKRCMKCGGMTFRHDGLKDDNSTWEECSKLCCISTHEGTNEVWYFCDSKKCECVHLECLNCNIYCNLVEHPGFTCNYDPINGYDSKTVRLKEFTDHIEYEEISSVDSDECRDEEYYNIHIPKEWNLKFIDQQKWCATGPDGGYGHAWKCRCCSIYEQYTDK